jgi:Na+/melibiose symporter-like transporter
MGDKVEGKRRISLILLAAVGAVVLVVAAAWGFFVSFNGTRWCLMRGWVSVKIATSGIVFSSQNQVPVAISPATFGGKSNYFRNR